jgi:16S rRNA (cytidine1402-2'-O)-methyltransferase
MGRRSSKPGTLYVVATPIGNLEDLTLRALRILKEVDWIASEDSRTTRKLLGVYDINTPLVSYHEQGVKRRGAWIIQQVRSGKDVALVSEAGTPGVSDPGYELIRDCLSEGLDVVPIPGPSAVLAALCVCGLPTDRFVFEGFLPRRRPQRIRTLKGLRGDHRTLVFFESPRRLESTLMDMVEVLGDRKAAIARELTKVFEEFRRGTLRQLLDWAKEAEPKGEFTIMVAGHQGDVHSLEVLRERVAFLKQRCGLGDREIVRVLREETKLPGKVIYSEVLREKQDSAKDLKDI